MASDQPALPRAEVQRQCPRCGKPVPPVELVTECPHCGYETRQPRRVPLAETIVAGDSTPVEPASLDFTVHRSASESDPLVGTDLDVYRIDGLLGRGGMGLVYLAHHRDLHRACALKVLQPDLAKE